MRHQFPLVVTFCVACVPAGERPAAAGPLALPAIQYIDCYDGVGFFEMEWQDLASRLPEGFTPLDGAFMGPEYEGKGLLALVYLSCPSSGADAQQWTMIATPVEDPLFSANLREVRWNWYELARLESDARRVETLASHGLAVAHASFSHEPFHEGDTESTFSVSTPEGEVINIRAALADSVNFEAQSHRFWHVASNGRILSTRLDFESHHSWVGSFGACHLDPRSLPTNALQGLTCSAVGITEAIEALDFTEQIVLWN